MSYHLDYIWPGLERSSEINIMSLGTLSIWASVETGRSTFYGSLSMATWKVWNIPIGVAGDG
jgi:hypothetical protein